MKSAFLWFALYTGFRHKKAEDRAHKQARALEELPNCVFLVVLTMDVSHNHVRHAHHVTVMSCKLSWRDLAL
eukprot:3527211-Amphidinium_carterae.1